MRWAGGFERRGGRGGAAVIGSTVWATGLASGLAAIAKFVCDTVCSRRLQFCTREGKRKKDRLVEKDFSLFFIFFFVKDFSFYFLFYERFLFFIEKG